MILFHKIQKIVRALFLPLIRRIPCAVNPKLIVIEGPWGLLDDNSGALLRRMIEAGVNKKYRISYWVTNRRHYQKISLKNVDFIDYKTFPNFLKAAWIMRRAKFYLFSNVTSPLGERPGQTHFYLSHGVPLKRYAGFKHHAESPIQFLSLSPLATSLWQVCNGLPAERFVELGFPRNDLFFRKNDVWKRLGLTSTPLLHVVWMPTFRHRKRERLFAQQPPPINDLPLFETAEQFNQLNTECIRLGILLILKLHSAQDMGTVFTQECPNIKVLTTEEDLAPRGIANYELLAESDALITDYSSVAFDFLLADKPIAYVVDDLDSYRQTVGFADSNPLSLMPGEKVNSIAEFIIFLTHVSENKDLFVQERRALRNRMHRYQDGQSADRVLQYLALNQLEK